MNTQLTDNEALELKALIAPSDKKLAKIEDLKKVKKYLLGLSTLYLWWRYDLNTLPKSIGNLTQLTRLSLFDCENLIALPDNIGDLTQLTGLDLRNCKNLTTLPESIGKLTQLTLLDLSDCENLTTLPESIGNLTQLTLLDLSDCENLTTLPESIGNLTQLTKLYLRGCKKLTTLPESIGNLTQLTELDLSGDKSTTLFFQHIDNFTQLKKLGLIACESLTTLPESIGKLTQLTELDLRGCKKLTTLPESIGKLTQLTLLYLRGCKNLTMLPESMQQLEKSKLNNSSLLSIAFICYRNSECKKAENKLEKAENYFLEIKYNKNHFFEYINIYYFYAQLFLALIYCKKEEWHKVQQCISEVKKSTNENYIKEVMDRINSIDNNYKGFLLKILLCYLEIRELLLVNMTGVLHSTQTDYESTFAYYTNPDVAIKLLAKDENGNSQQNPFQMGSISQVNDPSEGKVIFDYLNGLDILKNNNITLKPVSEFATFVGCFTFNHNKLNQFRLYGKEQEKEATGVSVVLNDYFFNLQKHTDINNSNQKKQDKKDKLTLYRCIYLSPKGDLNGEPYIQVGCRDEVTFYLEKGRTAEHWQEYIEDIQNIQNNVKQKFIEIKNNIQLLFEQIDNKKEKQQLIENVGFMLMPLSYMIKHSAYQEEQECRIFQFLPFNDKKIKIENKRMYVEYLPIDNYVKKIYLSPYAEQYADMFRALSNGRVEVRSSDNPFR